MRAERVAAIAWGLIFGTACVLAVTVCVVGSAAAVVALHQALL